MKKYKRFLAFFMVWSMLLSLPVYAEPSGEGDIASIAAASLDSDIGCDVNLMYDGMYYENAMIKTSSSACR